MPTTLTIRDETMTPGGADHVFELTFPTESITVRELIRERVYQEVGDYNQRIRTATPPERYRGLVTPTQEERRLNGATSPQAREVDWKRQFDMAIEAYQRNQILVLVGDRQTESLDETIQITAGTEVTFLRLVMLVGG
ncbi:MAG: hypothetical protein KDA33_04290 [Phycisphaerales bacterium]|nr:hypothetical protein [Phycisphaerales bacterium]